MRREFEWMRGLVLVKVEVVCVQVPVRAVERVVLAIGLTALSVMAAKMREG